MKKLLFTLFTLQFCIQSFSQVNFDQAYFIDNNNVRTECFIKNKDLYTNPTSFQYMFKKEESAVNVGNVESIKEFGIEKTMKYERNFVKIDTSSDNLNRLSEKSEPEWKEKTLYLKVLIEGEATLYEYKDQNSVRYFYKLNSGPVEQLINKEYYSDDWGNTTLRVNNEFERQLWTYLRCQNDITIDNIKMEYNKKKLSSYFKEYNKCKNYIFTDYSKKPTNNIHFKLVGGINIASTEYDYIYNGKSYNGSDVEIENFGDKWFFKYGAEIEYGFPSHGNKWAVFLESSYQKYKYGSIVSYQNSPPGVVENNYKIEQTDSYLRFGIGLRYYMYLNNNSSIFINATVLNNTYGFGFSYRRKYSLEFRSGDYSNAKYSIVLGYTLFNNNKQ